MVVRGLAEALADAGVLDWDGGPDQTTPYDGSESWPTFQGPEMRQTPNRQIAITRGVMSFIRADVITQVQFRVRGSQDGSPDEVGSKMQDILDYLYPNGFPRVHFQAGNIRIGISRPMDQLPLDPDSMRRRAMVQNFIIRTRRPRPS